MGSYPAETFRQVMEELSGRSRSLGAPANVTFFMGAGFPKSWDERFPTAAELYGFTCDELLSTSPAIAHFLSSLGNPTFDVLTPDLFKDLVFQLNMQLRYPDVRTRFMDECGLRLVLNEMKTLVQRRFESILPLNYPGEGLRFPLPKPLSPGQEDILGFFRSLRTEAGGGPAPVRLNFITTNHDFLLETILDNILGPHQSLFTRAYRGITPARVSGARNPRLVHDPRRAGLLIKLNGGFEILRAGGGPDGPSYHLDYRRRTLEEIRSDPPIIMLPSREQDYTDDYFAAVFPKAARLLRESAVLVVVGYSLPEEDALLRFLLRQFAEDLRDAAEKFVFYIDLMPEEQQLARLSQCFQYLRRLGGVNVRPCRGEFVDWVRGMGTQ